MVFEILEDKRGRRFLHIHTHKSGTTLIPIRADHMRRLNETIDDPVPRRKGGRHPFEILIGGDGKRFVYVNIDGGVTSMFPVDDDEDLDALHETLESPNPLYQEETNYGWI